MAIRIKSWLVLTQLFGFMLLFFVEGIAFSVAYGSGADIGGLIFLAGVVSIAISQFFYIGLIDRSFGEAFRSLSESCETFWVTSCV